MIKFLIQKGQARLSYMAIETISDLDAFDLPLVPLNVKIFFSIVAHHALVQWP